MKFFFAISFLIFGACTAIGYDRYSERKNSREIASVVTADFKSYVVREPDSGLMINRIEDNSGIVCYAVRNMPSEAGNNTTSVAISCTPKPVKAQ